MPAIDSLRAFDIENAGLAIWTFKKASYTGVAAPVYTGHWVESSEKLDAAIRKSLLSERDRITEVIEYGLLAQNNESSALSIEADETHAGLMLARIGDEVPSRKIKNLKEINNSFFYVIKLVAPDGSKLFAARKTDDSWRAKKLVGLISAVFSDDSLDLNEERTFNISNKVDFFVLGDNILISSKANFESVLSYKQAHIEDFEGLTQEQKFIDVFEEVEPIKRYVNENKIRLRRALAIQQKGHYKNPVFMRNLRDNYMHYGLNLQFDGNQKLIVTDDNCGHVFTALLDHRLTSPFSANIYDVQDTANVVV